MSPRDRLQEAERLLDAAVSVGYRITTNGDGLTVDRPPDLPAKRALSFSLAIREYRVEIMALILAMSPENRPAG